MPWWLIIPVLITAHVFVCLLMIGATLMQLPRSEGLGAAFGGGVTENLFGAQTTNVLAKFTVWLGIAFFVITLALAFAFAHDRPTGSRLEKELLASPQPTAAPTATPAAPAPSAPVSQPDSSPASSPTATPLSLQPAAPAEQPSVLQGTSNPLDLHQPAPSPTP